MKTPAVPKETPLIVILPSKYPNPAIKNTQKTKKLIVLIERMPPKSTIIKTSKNLLQENAVLIHSCIIEEMKDLGNRGRKLGIMNEELRIKNEGNSEFGIQNSEGC